MELRSEYASRVARLFHPQRAHEVDCGRATGWVCASVDDAPCDCFRHCSVSGLSGFVLFAYPKFHTAILRQSPRGVPSHFPGKSIGVCEITGVTTPGRLLCRL